MKIKIARIIVLCLIYHSTFAQTLEKLSLNDVIQIGLENNYSIQIAKNNLEISQTNKQIGKAQLLPTIDGVAAYSKSVNDTRQEFLSGGINERNGAQTTNSSAGIQLNWTLFDGFKMFASYDKIKEYEVLGEANIKYTVQTKMLEITMTYFAIVSEKQQIASLNDALEISQKRVQIFEDKFAVGAGSKLDLLNAKVDYNTDLSNLRNEENILTQYKIKLNELLLRDTQSNFELTDTIQISNNLVYQDLEDKIKKESPEVLIALSQKRISNLNIKEIKAGRYPTIKFNSGYNYSNQISEASIFSSNRNLGFNYGVTANINLFNGLAQSKKEKNARIENENANYFLAQTEKRIESELAILYSAYSTNLKLIDRERENKEIAKQNLTISIEKYRLGGIASIQLREAQQNYIDATTRYVNALYQTKLAELSLKQLTGSL